MAERVAENGADETGAAGTAANNSGRVAVRLAVAAVLCLIAAGGLLWWREGDAVFQTLVESALAWCM